MVIGLVEDMPGRGDFSRGTMGGLFNANEFDVMSLMPFKKAVSLCLTCCMHDKVRIS